MKIRIDALDQKFSEYIRKRAMKLSGGCQRCGARKESWKQLQCAHFHGRSAKSVRHDPDNAIGCCYGCHSYLDGHPMEKVEFFKTLLGEEAFDKLNSRARITHPKPDKKLLMIYYKEKLEV